MEEHPKRDADRPAGEGSEGEERPAGSDEQEGREARREPRQATVHAMLPSKRQRIVELYRELGERDLDSIAARVGARPSYVAQVLQAEGLLESLSDLYATTERMPSAYAAYFRDVLHFKTVEDARRSVARLEELFRHFDRLKDRSGQHQAMVMALIGMNRARWSGKLEEAEVFRHWLHQH